MTDRPRAQRRHERWQTEVAHMLQTSRNPERFLAQQAADCTRWDELLAQASQLRSGQGRRARDLLDKLRRAYGDDATARCERLHEVEFDLVNSREEPLRFLTMGQAIDGGRYRSVIRIINKAISAGRNGDWVNWPIK